MRRRLAWCLIVLVYEIPCIGLPLVLIGPWAALLCGIVGFLVALVATSCCSVA